MSFKIGLGLCYYEDLEGIKRLYDSLYKINAKIDLILAIDGRYKQFTSVLDDSTNILSSCDVHSYLISNPRFVTINYTNWKDNPTEIQKRNKYLEYCKKEVNGIVDLDFLIIIDTDEYFEGDWQQFYENVSKLKQEIDDPDNEFYTRNPGIKFIHHMKMYDKEYDAIDKNVNRPRLFYKPYNLEYIGCHYTWQNRITKQRERYGPYMKVDGLTIVHDSSHRPIEYEQTMREYQRIQPDLEQFYL